MTFLLYIRASVVAAWAIYQNKGLEAAVATAWRVLRFITSRKTRGLADAHTITERMLACMECPLYNARWKTCGTWRVSLNVHGEQMGCLCFMPYKMRYDKATCWINDNLHEDEAQGYGWRR